MKNHKLFIFVALVATFSFASCSKETTTVEPTTPVSSTDIMTKVSNVKGFTEAEIRTLFTVRVDRQSYFYFSPTGTEQFQSLVNPIVSYNLTTKTVSIRDSHPHSLEIRDNKITANFKVSQGYSINTTFMGTVDYFSYTNKNKTAWVVRVRNFSVRDSRTGAMVPVREFFASGLHSVGN